MRCQVLVGFVCGVVITLCWHIVDRLDREDRLEQDRAYLEWCYQQPSTKLLDADREV